MKNGSLIVDDIVGQKLMVRIGRFDVFTNESEYALADAPTTPAMALPAGEQSFLWMNRTTKSDRYGYPLLPSSGLCIHYGLLTSFDIDDALYLDIETTGLGIEDPIVMIGLRYKGRNYIIKGSESDMIRKLMAFIRLFSPKYIVGHNICGFDIPHLLIRSGGEIPFHSYSASVRIMGKNKSYTLYRYSDRYATADVIDTYILAQKDPYFAFSAKSFGLKALVKQYIGEVDFMVDDKFLNIEGEEERLAYLISDLMATENLFKLLVGWWVATAKPFGFVDIYKGNATLLSHIILGLRIRKWPTPYPRKALPFEGAYADMLASGYFKSCWKIDAVSMYPNIMRRYRPYWDKKGWFSVFVEALLSRRKEAKANGNKAVSDALKVFINSLYGMMGSGGLFADPSFGSIITSEGTRLISYVSGVIRKEGGIIIEIDTDGIIFSADESVAKRVYELASAEAEFELSYLGDAVVLKAKNYIYGDDGGYKTHGNSIRNRFDKDFIKDLMNSLTDVIWEHRSEPKISDYIVDMFIDLFNAHTENIRKPSELKKEFNRGISALERFKEYEPIYEAVVVLRRNKTEICDRRFQLSLFE